MLKEAVRAKLTCHPSRKNMTAKDVENIKQEIRQQEREEIKLEKISALAADSKLDLTK